MILEAIDTSYIKFVMNNETYIQTKRKVRFVQAVLRAVDNFKK